MEWHSMNAEQISKYLKVRIETGLNSDDAKKRFLKFGANALIQSKPPNFFKKLIAQFSDFMVITLIIAAVISLITSIFSQNSDYIDSIIIISIVVINAAIGIIQESKAEKEIES
ncbi:MAG: cation-transporting P-type ATPase, partial [Acutalibacteraceae bacterium]